MEPSPDSICERIRTLSDRMLGFFCSQYALTDPIRQQAVEQVARDILYDRARCISLGINYVTPSTGGTIRARAYALHLIENSPFG